MLGLPKDIITTSPPEWLKEWLLEEGSLTAKLQKITGASALKPLRNNWQKPDWWANHVLLHQEDKVFQREIIISSHGLPCWYARTIIPSSTYYTFCDIFEKLATKSLGDIIFSEPHIERTALCFYKVEKENIEYYWPKKYHLKVQEGMWTKLSHFMIDARFPFYLSEIFLPEFSLCLEQYGAPTGD